MYRFTIKPVSFRLTLIISIISRRVQKSRSCQYLCKHMFVISPTLLQYLLSKTNVHCDENALSLRLARLFLTRIRMIAYTCLLYYLSEDTFLDILYSFQKFHYPSPNLGVTHTLPNNFWNLKNEARITMLQKCDQLWLYSWSVSEVMHYIKSNANSKEN